MSTRFHDLADLIADEERAALSNAIAKRITEIADMPDGPVRARIFAAAAMIGGAELMRELEGPGAAAKQLRNLADRFETQAGPLQ